ncbi:MAG TPA: hypothetical protein VLA48_07990 [Nitrososphaeraceae archaeon]|nr:hypothetical protein [Nitrososphaeraceae archaeon]
MNQRPVSIELPEEVCEIIDNNFKLNGETDSEILSNIINNHLASNRYYPDAESLMHGIGLKEVVDTQHDMIMSVIDLLEKKGLTTYQEWAQTMQERIRKNTQSFN